jgi:hypothetical protein
MPIKRYVSLLLVVCGVAVVGLTASASAASPSAPGTGWEVTSTVFPTNLPPGGTGAIEVSLYNIGAEPSNGTVTVVDTLPRGVTATAAGRIAGYDEEIEEGWNCSGIGTEVVTCTNDEEVYAHIPLAELGSNITQIGIEVNVAGDVGATGTNQVTVSGGGAPVPASTSEPVVFSSSPASVLGFQGSDAWFGNANGTVDTQAGSHPYSFTASFDLNTDTTYGTLGEPILRPAGGQVRDVLFNLPPGIVGNPTAVPQCTSQQFDDEQCPVDTQLGVDSFDALGGARFADHLTAPVYNLVPPPGVPAEFAFNAFGRIVFLKAAVRSGGDYGLSAHADNLPLEHVMGNRLTLWGEPSDPSHNPYRDANGAGCPSGCASSGPRTPFLTLPTACEGPQAFSALPTSWASLAGGEYSFESHDAGDQSTGFTGCEDLGFGPSISAVPDTGAADTPAGLTVDVKVPQEGLASGQDLATSNIKDTTVTLPVGMAINPGQAAGLQACQAAEAKLETGEAPGDEAAPSCPNASKVGVVKIKTPLLTEPLEGNVYVLQSNPPNLKLLIAASAEGVNLKLPANVTLNETTGQITTTLAKTPELPFTDFELSFSGGAQAALTTPTKCGTYSAATDFTPWSTPFVPDALETSNFSIDSGTGGAACPGSSLPFSPSLTAGSTTDQAGGFTDFSLLLQRADDQQRVSTLQFKTPEGLLGMISKVPLCPEPQAAEGTCSSASEIGHTVVTAGPGPYPLVVPQPGQPPAPIYLTGGYKGAPYGLSIVVPLHVGPFTLQTQVVRAKIEVDPHTAQLTITTDPLPSIIDGIPTDLRTINAVVDRPGFMFNPTNCSSQEFAGTATSTEGATAAISSHFQMGSCQSLKFAPDFNVTTQAKTSKADGASLEARIVYPTTPLGANQASSQANVKSVKVDLPKQLPSRLTTLQKACVAKVFEANPAACPKDSVVGHATAITPVLPVPLNGPAYFVSHGGEAFPSLIIVLQGYGVTVDLVGTTFISKTGITSSTFKQVPDVPISSFTLTLPTGAFSALAANLPESAHGDLCGQSLQMPTAFVGQNGAEIHDTTTIGITGCTDAKSLSRAQKLAKALKACKDKNKARRAECEKAARNDYGPTKKTKKK